VQFQACTIQQIELLVVLINVNKKNVFFTRNKKRMSLQQDKITNFDIKIVKQNFFL